MEILKNRAKVIQKNRIRDGWVVLAQQRKSWGMEYVTWVTDENMNCYHGHYSKDIIIATQDFKERYLDHC